MHAYVISMWSSSTLQSVHTRTKSILKVKYTHMVSVDDFVSVYIELHTVNHLKCLPALPILVLVV